MLEALALVLTLGVIVESLTFLLRKAEPIQPLIEFFTSKSGFLDKLFSCGYCLSFWVSVGSVCIYKFLASNPVILFQTNLAEGTINFLITLLIVHRFSNIVHGSIDKYFDRHNDKRYRSFFDELE